MGLSSNMWTSVSGLLSHGEKMGVIGNNIANISTLAYKSQRMNFSDFLYQDAYSASGPTQMGKGVSINSVVGDFAQGGTESTSEATDMSIAGKGFFEVRDPFSNQRYYTRAGNFQFDNNNALRTPGGEIVQGWAVPEGGTVGTGAPTDVILSDMTVPPKATTSVEMTVNLDNRVADKTSNSKNPMFSLFSVWDGTQPASSTNPKPISENAYQYPGSVTVYDEAGTPRILTTYFDKVDGSSIDNLPGGWSVYEYMVTMDPKEDERTYGGKYNPATGVLEDDLLSYTAPDSLSMSKAGLDNDSLPGFSNGAANDAEQLLTDMNLVLGLPDTTANPPKAALTLSDVNVKQYPSGGWYLDPDDRYVKEAIAAAGAGPLADPTVLARLTASSTPALPGAVDPVTGIIAPADPLDANLVKKMSETKSSGVVMMGTMVFNGAGQLVDQSAYTYMGNTNLGANEVNLEHPNDLTSWEPAPISDDGYPLFAPNFSGNPMGNTMHQNPGANSISREGGVDGQIEFNMGLKSSLQPGQWTNPTGDASTAGLDYAMMSYYLNSEPAPNTSTSYGSTSITQSPRQDGYTFGSLTNYTVDSQGILHGMYSNGVRKPLFQVGVYDFVNYQGLRREGNNLFSSSQDSGQPRVGPAGQSGLGSITAYSLEQSNVDLSKEFVYMISTQRGYQANSKNITTTDSMLETVINLVR